MLPAGQRYSRWQGLIESRLFSCRRPLPLAASGLQTDRVFPSGSKMFVS